MGADNLLLSSNYTFLTRGASTGGRQPGFPGSEPEPGPGSGTGNFGKENPVCFLDDLARTVREVCRPEES